MQNFEGQFKRFGGVSGASVETPTPNPTPTPQYTPRTQNVEQVQTSEPTPEKLPNGNTQVSVNSFKKEVANSMQDKTIADSILSSVDNLVQNASLVIPDGYNVANEIKSAYYSILTVDGVNGCTTMSIANALTETAIQGLSVQKKQCYYIKYGNAIQMQRSYFGDIALVKRTGLVKDVYAVVIYEGDEIETGFDDYGMECVKHHKTKFGNQDNPIIGAYAVAVGINDYKRYCIMTKRQLENNWKLSKSRDTSKFLRDFPEEASKRTAIRRLIKMIFNTAIDLDTYQDQVIGSYERTLEQEYMNDDIKEKTTESMNAKVAEFSNISEVEDDL